MPSDRDGPSHRSILRGEYGSAAGSTRDTVDAFRRNTLKLNAKIIFGGVIVLAAIYYWLIARHWSVRDVDNHPAITVVYLFTFRMFPFADVLWTIAGASLLYRGIEEARAA
jgi:hypothetical protein